MLLDEVDKSYRLSIVARELRLEETVLGITYYACYDGACANRSSARDLSDGGHALAKTDSRFETAVFSVADDPQCGDAPAGHPQGER